MPHPSSIETKNPYLDLATDNATGECDLLRADLLDQSDLCLLEANDGFIKIGKAHRSHSPRKYLSAIYRLHGKTFIGSDLRSALADPFIIPVCRRIQCDEAHGMYRFHFELMHPLLVWRRPHGLARWKWANETALVVDLNTSASHTSARELSRTGELWIGGLTGDLLTLYYYSYQIKSERRDYRYSLKLPPPREIRHKTNFMEIPRKVQSVRRVSETDLLII